MLNYEIKKINQKKAKHYNQLQKKKTPTLKDDIKNIEKKLKIKINRKKKKEKNIIAINSDP